MGLAVSTDQPEPGNGAFGPRRVMRLARGLNKLRMSAGVSLTQFTNITGISQIRISAIESGQVIPDRDVIHAYFQVLPNLSEHDRHQIRRLHASVESLGTPPTEADRLVELAEQRGKPTAAPRSDTDSTTIVITEKDGTTDEVDPDGGRRPGSSSDTRVVIAKPAFRQTVSKSQADPSQWPDPDTIDTVKQFTAAMEAIKLSTAMSYQALAKESKDKYPLARSTVHSMCTKNKLPSNPQQVQCFIQIAGGSVRDANKWAARWQHLAQHEKHKDRLASDQAGIGIGDNQFGVWVAELDSKTEVGVAELDNAITGPSAPPPPPTAMTQMAWWFIAGVLAVGFAIGLVAGILITVITMR